MGHSSFGPRITLNRMAAALRGAGAWRRTDRSRPGRRWPTGTGRDHSPSQRHDQPKWRPSSTGKHPGDPVRDRCRGGRFKDRRRGDRDRDRCSSSPPGCPCCAAAGACTKSTRSLGSRRAPGRPPWSAPGAPDPAGGEGAPSHLTPGHGQPDDAERPADGLPQVLRSYHAPDRREPARRGQPRESAHPGPAVIRPSRAGACPRPARHAAGSPRHRQPRVR
jgi:hypothetical protein